MVQCGLNIWWDDCTATDIIDGKDLNERKWYDHGRKLTFICQYPVKDDIQGRGVEDQDDNN